MKSVSRKRNEQSIPHTRETAPSKAFRVSRTASINGPLLLRLMIHYYHEHKKRTVDTPCPRDRAIFTHGVSTICVFGYGCLPCPSYPTWQFLGWALEFVKTTLMLVPPSYPWVLLMVLQHTRYVDGVAKCRRKTGKIQFLWVTNLESIFNRKLKITEIH